MCFFGMESEWPDSMDFKVTVEWFGQPSELLLCLWSVVHFEHSKFESMFCHVFIVKRFVYKVIKDDIEMSAQNTEASIFEF